MATYNDEIDLRPYILAALRKWWLIAIFALLGAGIAFLYSYAQARSYQATALVLLTRNRAALELAENFPTSNEPIDFRSRMDALLALGESDNLFTSTYEEIKATYPDFSEYEDFKDSVTISSQGDTIEVTVSHPDPDVAALAANLWAKQFITAINAAYSGEQLPSEIQANLRPARKEFNTAQANLEAFIETNRIDYLQKEVTEIGSLLDEMVEDRTWQVSYNIRRKQKMEQIINEAVALREQMNSPSSSPAAQMGNAIAVVRLYNEAFKDDPVSREIRTGTSPEQGEATSGQETTILESQSPTDMVLNLQVNELINESGSSSAIRNDLDRLVDLATEEKQKAEENLAVMAEDSLNVVNDPLILSLSARLSDLRSQLEEETARLNELTSLRDLKLNAYQSLAEKETEVRNNLQTSAIVSLVSPALPPVSPANRGLIRNALIGGVLGFILGLGWVVLAQWFQTIEQPKLDLQKVDIS